MPSGHALVDHDILLKAACYDILGDVVGHASDRGFGLAALAAARFVLPSKIRRSSRISDKAGVASRLEAGLARVSLEEPSDDEVRFAADLADLAARRGVDLDPGEAQLLAMLVRRSAPLLLTGDKRAIAAIEVVAPEAGAAEAARGKVACLEQLMRSMLRRLGAERLRAAVCREPGADRAMAVSFACASAGCGEESILAGLGSYLRDVRGAAPTVVLPGEDASAWGAQEDRVGRREFGG